MFNDLFNNYIRVSETFRFFKIIMKTLRYETVDHRITFFSVFSTVELCETVNCY